MLLNYLAQITPVTVAEGIGYLEDLGMLPIYLAFIGLTLAFFVWRRVKR